MPALRNSLNIRSRVMWVRAFFNTYKRRVIAAGGVIQNEPCAVRSFNNNLLRSASWTLVPSGIEEDIVFAQKPISGLGDLQFTRASDATYTDASGVVRRSPYNLVTFSEMFADASWSKLNGASVVANTETAPNGTLTADTLTFTSTTDSRVEKTVSGLVVGNTYTWSVYLKVASGTLSCRLYGIDTTSGTAITVTNQWVRYSITQVASGATRFPAIVGTGVAGSVFAWGAQLVEGSEALPYFATTDRLNVPRLDYRNADGTLSTCPRLLLEPQRTNSIRNSSMVGASTGSPGQFPSNWTSNNGGLTRTVVGIGTENGLPYIDVRFNGTTTGTSVDVGFEGTSSISTTTGQTWTQSFYFKTITSQPNSFQIHQFEYNSVGGFVTQANQPFSPTATLQRFTWSRAMAGATTAFVYPFIRMNVTNGATYDFTIRIAAPQMELGAYATTWVPTTTTAVTRIADVASKTGVASLIGQTEGTLFAEVNMRNLVIGARILTVNNGTVDNRAMLFYTSGTLTFGVNSGSVTVATIAFPTTTQGSYKLAAAYKQNDFVFYVNGVQVGTDTSGATPSSLSRIDVGNELGFNVLSDTIAQAALFPTRLTNAQLAQLTTL